jgi:hypothetical protein
MVHDKTQIAILANETRGTRPILMLSVKHGAMWHTGRENDLWKGGSGGSASVRSLKGEMRREEIWLLGMQGDVGEGSTKLYRAKGRVISRSAFR